MASYSGAERESMSLRAVVWRGREWPGSKVPPLGDAPTPSPHRTQAGRMPSSWVVRGPIDQARRAGEGEGG
jgi:hypothetical protein